MSLSPIRLYVRNNSIIGSTEDLTRVTTLSGYIDKYYTSMMSNEYSFYNLDNLHITSINDNELVMCNDFDSLKGISRHFTYIGTVKNKEEYNNLFPEYFI